MNLRVSSFALLSVLFCSSLLVVAGRPLDDESRRDLAEAVRHRPVGGLVEELNTQAWASPSIRSSAYSSRLQDVRQKEVVDLNREIGASIAERIEESAARLVESANPAALQRESEALLTLANWLGQESGYGNLLLVARCHDVAAIGMAKLAVDESVSLKTVQDLLNACDTAVYSPHHRAQVLNTELGETVVDLDGLSEEAAQQRLERTWEIGRVLCRRQRRGQDSTELDRVPGGVDLPKLKEHIVLFEESPAAREAVAKPLTEAWGVFQPQQLVAGLRPKNIAFVQSLVEFREKVGSFPDVGGTQEEGKAAFEAAWRQHWDIESSRRQRTLYSTAWHAYSQVQAGAFVDADTLRSRVRSASEL